ncbi:MAG: 3',5'-cyclic-nucleotide phosphodiesterase [Candidatus Rokubacteria bacterium]|nr:3',5'-cyclic-nucleotide phosphodiesterase [Candidatus Rokubacteria bacterium]
MKIHVLGAGGGDRAGHRLPAFLVDDHLLLDAGGAAAALSLQAQDRVEYVVLSHAHLDHSVGLAFLADNRALSEETRPITALALEPVLADLRAHCFNDALWPDFSRLPTPENPTVRFRALPSEAESRVGRCSITAIPVHHTVPASGFLLDDGKVTLAYTGDTGPTVAFWQALRGTKRLKAVFAECSFPNRMEELAVATGHLTPALLRRELDRLPASFSVHVFHLKPAFYEETAEEVARLDAPIKLLKDGELLTL